MNPLNYASLPASKRLVEAGIVLETDLMWRKVIGNDRKEYFLLSEFEGEFPAPSMAEVWRELRSYGQFPCSDGDNWWLCDDNAENISPEMSDTNPTDALIDLLIFIKGLDAPQ